MIFYTEVPKPASPIDSHEMPIPLELPVTTATFAILFGLTLYYMNT